MRLLQRTIRLYSILSLVVLLLGIPVFYFLLQSVVKEEVDEELTMDKAQVIQRLNRMRSDSDLRQFNFLDHDISVTLNDTLGAKPYDLFTTFDRYDSVIDETVNMRRLETNVIVQGKPYLIRITTSMVDHNDLIQVILIVQIILIVLLFAGLWLINKSISSAYLLQKEFTENAAHEMQTPLAIFQSKLELLMQTTPLTDNQAELIGKMADAGQRMNKLNKGLLLLTRIQNNQFTDSERVDIESVLDKVLEQYEDAIYQKNIALTVKKISSAKIDVNRTLMEILIGNMLSNAIRHNVQGGSINIILHERDLYIENTGSTKPLNTIKLFQRFQKETSDSNSLGLGLEIIDKICTLNHFSFKYQYQFEKHSFTIKF